ncbi:3-dehydroquinate synthase [Sutterella sp. CAG:351]|nr:3-dehydroquinate synthase [Sutterella sp. CAG:351]
MQGDKKSFGGHIRFIVLKRIGESAIQEVPDAILRETLLQGGYIP